LRSYSRNHNMRLVDVAQAVIAGSLPASALGPLAQKGTGRRMPT
jgi:hypothetical protein